MKKLMCLVLMLGLLVVELSVPGDGVAKKGPKPKDPGADKVLFFVADGMRPDLLEKYAAKGGLPTYATMIKKGVQGKNGLVQAFPPNTGVGWYTLATGTYPSEHGSTNNTFFRTGDSFNNRTAAFSAGVLQADTIAEAAERAGKKVASIEWSGGSRTMTLYKVRLLTTATSTQIGVFGPTGMFPDNPMERMPLECSTSALISLTRQDGPTYRLVSARQNKGHST